MKSSCMEETCNNPYAEHEWFNLKRVLNNPCVRAHAVQVTTLLVAASSAAVVGWAPEAVGSGIPEVMA